MVKCLSTMQETWVRSLGWEVPWRRKWQPTPGSCLENPMDREAWYPWGRKESDRTERLHFHFLFSCYSISSSNCCFLTCIQVSLETGQVVWYSHLFHNFPQFILIHTVKGFGIVNKAEIDVFLELSCFFDDPADVGNLICGSSAFPKTSSNIWKFTVHILLKPGLENFKHYFTSV